jgi:hypothetical protein
MSKPEAEKHDLFLKKNQANSGEFSKLGLIYKTRNS